MLVYMDHEKHGVHIAYGHDEIKRLEANGWVLRNPQPEDAHYPEGLIPKKDEVRVVPAIDFHDAPKKKRGRPAKVS